MAEKMNEGFDGKDDSGLPPVDYGSQQPPQYQMMERGPVAGVQPQTVTVPQTVVVQPQASTLQSGLAVVNVVEMAPNNQIINVNPGTKDWSAGLCSCFNDICNCFCVMCCPVISMMNIANRLGENSCIICYVPGSMITLRTKLRLLAGIRGSVCNDCCTWCWCSYCVICQMKREMDNAGIPNSGC